MDRTESGHLKGVKERIFKTVLLISAIAFIFISIVNLFNKRPFINFIFPFIASFIVLFMYRYYRIGKYSTLIKSVYLVFVCILYLPSAWLTSPGSYSAMSFYAILILFISIILAEKTWEYIFPVMVIIETIVLLNYEPLIPERYTLYSDPYVRAIDLTINYLVVAIIIFIVLFVLNTYFDKEHNKIFVTAITDSLTGLYNRRFIHEYLYTSYDKVPMNRSKFAIIMIDLNNFKRVNDSYGHDEGDNVLKEFSSILRDASRKEDLAGRYGGDEFIVILSGADEKIAKLVKTRIMELFKVLEDKYKDIELSVGVGICESGDYKIDEIIKLADERLYINKLDKKNKNMEK